MAIVIILASISIPAFISITRGSGIRYTVRTVNNYLSLARQRAIMDRDDITFHYAGNEFWVELGDGTQLATVTNAPDVNFAGSGSLTFRSDGSAGGATYTDIVISDSQSGMSRTVQVNQMTGGISVK